MDEWLNASESPSKRWRVEWEDGNGAIVVNGHRTAIAGRARLPCDGRVDRQLENVERPQDAAVNNASAAVVLDATGDGPGRPTYRAAVLFYHGESAPVIHRFRANPDDMFLSHQSDLVVVRLCDTADEDEVGVARFRLSTGERVFANQWPR